MYEFIRAPEPGKQAVGEDLVDSIVGDNIPILTEAEKFNETVLSSVKRVQAHLLGAPRPHRSAHAASLAVNEQAWQPLPLLHFAHRSRKCFACGHA